ncbi:MAG: hypothetical protein IPJ93_02380 [Bacteroidota bacterium]|nr:MAG: hypothetical protein IPJ93_02380 [Bacteroidota bacterium]
MAAALVSLYQGVITVTRDSGFFPMCDVDMGQLENDGESLPLECPAMLMKIEDVIWRDVDDDLQMGVVNISLKMIFQFSTEEEIITIPGEGRAEVIKILNLIEEYHTMITNLSGDSFNKLRRFNQYQLPINPKNLYWIHVLQYQCNIRSDSHTPDASLDLDFDSVKNNNAFMERRKLNLIHK